MTDRSPQAAGEPTDLVPVKIAADLLSLTPHRLRQLVRAGHLPDGPRGRISLLGAVQGYVHFLKAETSKPESTAGTAAHQAKAELISAATERRRAGLVPRQDAEHALSVIRTSAARHLRGLTGRRALAGLDAETHAKVEAEVSAALTRIDAAHTDALRALRTGDSAMIEGAGG